jgi:hypothetical protein
MMTMWIFDMETILTVFTVGSWNYNGERALENNYAFLYKSEK